MTRSVCDIVTLTMNPALDLATSVERVEPTHKLRCGPVRQDPGGGGINVARVCQRLGAPALALYAAGGAAGRTLTSLLQAEGLAVRPLRIRGDTREDFTVTETSSGLQYRFVLPGPEMSEAEQRRCLSAIGGLPAGGWMVASGSLPPGAPPSFMTGLALLAKARGRRLALDASGQALAAGLVGGVHLVKPNLAELSEHCGRSLSSDADRLAACNELIHEGQAEIVALTLGGEGAMLVTAKAAWRAEPLSVVPVSTVGAGDSFVGGLVSALARGLSLETAFRTAVAAGSAALLAPGTELCRAADVRRLMPEVRLVPLGLPGRGARADELRAG